jgi:ATP-utilising chromatin assembly and remodelling N-terminal
MTYKEAADSESKARDKMVERFPNVWRQAALEIIQFSTFA